MFYSKKKPSSTEDGATLDTDIRLIDFGLSKRYDTHRSFGSLAKLSSFVGTNFYQAPEVVEESGYTHSCDLWSVGILAYALLSAKPPFGGKDDEKFTTTLATVMRGVYNSLWQIGRASRMTPRILFGSCL